LPVYPRAALERFWRGDPGEDPIPERDVMDPSYRAPRPSRALRLYQTAGYNRRRCQQFYRENAERERERKRMEYQRWRSG
jgi:hypothetical protein